MTVDAHLITAINSGVGYFTVLVKLTARAEKGGDEIRVALFDNPITFEAEVYDAATFIPSTMESRSDVESVTGAITHLFGADFTNADLRGGKWGGARVEVIQIDHQHPEWGALKRFFGRIGDAKDTGLQSETQIRGLMDLLSQPTGWRTSRLCRYQLGDANCTLNLADFTFNGQVVTIANQQRINTSLDFVVENGLRGKYYVGPDFDHLYRRRLDSVVNFDWGLGPPMVGLPANGWSIQWDGWVTAPASLNWTFYLTIWPTVNGVRLYVNDMVTPVIDKWNGGGVVPYSATIALTSGVPTLIRVQFRDRAAPLIKASARCFLKWEAPGHALEVVPVTALTTPGDTGAEDHYFQKGKLTWTTGDNTGLDMETADNTGNTIILYQPMLKTIQVGDEFTIQAGDPKDLTTCFNRFHNAINFGGESDMPTRDTIFKIPE